MAVVCGLCAQWLVVLSKALGSWSCCGGVVSCCERWVLVVLVKAVGSWSCCQGLLVVL